MISSAAVGRLVLPFRLARRFSWRGMRIVIACLALGVAAIAAVGGLRDGIAAGIAANGRTILGGDLEVASGYQPMPPAAAQWLVAHGARVSAVEQMRAMLIAANGERALVELKVVDPAWPLVGRARFQPATTSPDASGITVDPLLLSRLRLRVGDTVRLGDARLVVRGVILREPDHAATPSLLGPRVLIAQSLLPRTGLVQPGSMIDHMLRAAWPAGSDLASLRRQFRAAFPGGDLRLRDPHDAVPGATRFIDQLAVFMTLVGLASLLVGGIGVATGVRAWLDREARTIAILRCLGASSGMVFATALIQVALLAACGILLGLAAGALLPGAALAAFRGVLPVPPVPGLYVAPLGRAALFGVLVALAFALPPLARARQIPGAALFRDTLLPARLRPPALLIAVDAVLVAALVGLAVASSPDPRLAVGFCAAALVTLLLFRLGAAGLMAAARVVAPRLPSAFRLGAGNLYRPGNATPLMLVAVGLGLSTLATIALIQGNLTRQLLGQIPKAAPSFYFMDIQPDQLARFDAVVRGVKGSSGLDQVPYIASRVTKVNGVPAAQVHATPDTQWALHGGRGLALTVLAAAPRGSPIVAGRWWAPDYDGPPLVSFDASLARGWGVRLGDTLSVDVLGREVTMRVASLRAIDWKTLAMNFAMVASPGLLSGAPHSELATVRVPPAQQGTLLREVTDALPNVTGIRVADVLAAVGRLLGQIGAAFSATGAIALGAGALVLAGAVASGQRRRVAEAVVLKTLGATRGQIRRAWMAEFGALGLAAGLIAGGIGAASSYAMMHYVLHASWSPLPARLAATIVGCVVLMLGLGYAGTESALRARAAPLLRHP